ncbi:clan AA aspartic protease [Candidatus Roizmanbacteria bacterium]|nr:clan AA aspartic protease [Candidatus Roizmanbacteria bacterium]
MGLTTVDLTIKNPHQSDKHASENFLVDSGASYTVVPEAMVRKLNLKPSFDREFTLADGKKVRRSIGSAIVRYGNEEISSPVVLGKKGDSALLGVITLESFGLALDPFQRKLYKAKMML